MPDHLKGKVIVVTGTASGFGRELVRLAGARGSRVVAVDLPGPELAKAEAELRAEGVDVLAVAADVTDREQMHAMAAAALARFGAIDVLVNNAGDDAARLLRRSRDGGGRPGTAASR